VKKGIGVPQTLAKTQMSFYGGKVGEPREKRRGDINSCAGWVKDVKKCPNRETTIATWRRRRNRKKVPPETDLKAFPGELLGTGPSVQGKTQGGKRARIKKGEGGTFLWMQELRM